MSWMLACVCARACTCVCACVHVCVCMRSVCVVWLCCNFAKCLSVCQFVTCMWVIVPISGGVILCTNNIGVHIFHNFCVSC